MVDIISGAVIAAKTGENELKLSRKLHLTNFVDLMDTL